MNNELRFREFMKLRWKISTINHYVGAIRTISDELFNRGVIDTNIYLISDKRVVESLCDVYLGIDELKNKDLRGNRMYSNALKRYNEFFNQRSMKISIREEIITYDEHDDLPKCKGKKRVLITEKIMRDSTVSSNALQSAGYICEYNSSHLQFISKTTHRPYMEAHHLIPMSAFNNFESSIDVESNVVSLCVVCHKLLHHASWAEKEPILKKLYSMKEERLRKSNIHITFSELIEYYL